MSQLARFSKLFFVFMGMALLAWPLAASADEPVQLDVREVFVVDGVAYAFNDTIIAVSEDGLNWAAADYSAELTTHLLADQTTSNCVPNASNICFRSDGSRDTVYQSTNAGDTWGRAWFAGGESALRAPHFSADIDWMGQPAVLPRDGEYIVLIPLGDEGVLSLASENQWRHFEFVARESAPSPQPIRSEPEPIVVERRVYVEPNERLEQQMPVYINEVIYEPMTFWLATSRSLAEWSLILVVATLILLPSTMQMAKERDWSRMRSNIAKAVLLIAALHFAYVLLDSVHIGQVFGRYFYLPFQVIIFLANSPLFWIIALVGFTVGLFLLNASLDSADNFKRLRRTVVMVCFFAMVPFYMYHFAWVGAYWLALAGAIVCGFLILSNYINGFEPREKGPADIA